ncbi:MAG: exosortase-associated EpsI family protein [Luteolibacter sp.]
MKWKPWILPLAVGGMLSGIYFLPQTGGVAQSAVKMELPRDEGSWVFKTIPPSEKELGALAKDTEFSKAICLSPRPGEVTPEGYSVPDRIDLSIVLSGYDLNNSIHRPERCMPAQGHTILSSADRRVKLANGREITVKRLLSTQTLQAGEGRETTLDCITYYFFIGHDQTTQNHLDRTLIDMKDRLFFGMDQRWAYVSMSMWFGKVPWIGETISPEEVDGKLSAFLSRFAEAQIDWQQIRR